MIARIRQYLSSRFKGYVRETLVFLYRNGMMKSRAGDEEAFLKEEVTRLTVENATLKVMIEEMQLRLAKGSAGSGPSRDEGYSTGA